jgi:hypothetical protein
MNTQPPHDRLRVKGQTVIRRFSVTYRLWMSETGGNSYLLGRLHPSVLLDYASIAIRSWQMARISPASAIQPSSLIGFALYRRTPSL